MRMIRQAITRNDFDLDVGFSNSCLFGDYRGRELLTRQNYHTDRSEDLHPAETAFAIFRGLKFVEVRKTDAHMAPVTLRNDRNFGNLILKLFSILLRVYITSYK